MAGHWESGIGIVPWALNSWRMLCSSNILVCPDPNLPYYLYMFEWGIPGYSAGSTICDWWDYIPPTCCILYGSMMSMPLIVFRHWYCFIVYNDVTHSNGIQTTTEFLGGRTCNNLLNRCLIEVMDCKRQRLHALQVKAMSYLTAYQDYKERMIHLYPLAGQS